MYQKKTKINVKRWQLALLKVVAETFTELKKMKGHRTATQCTNGKIDNGKVEGIFKTRYEELSNPY